MDLLECYFQHHGPEIREMYWGYFPVPQITLPGLTPLSPSPPVHRVGPEHGWG